MRRLFVVLTVALCLPALAAKPALINTSAEPWRGAAGRLVHGYIAIPGKARGRQPAVLVLADPAAGGPGAARALVDTLARAGFLACTPRGDEGLADLTASLVWLQTNRYATGRVALVALGGMSMLRANEIADMAVAPPAALLVLADQSPAPGPVPALGLPPLGPGAPLPSAATAFLKEHLR